MKFLDAELKRLGRDGIAAVAGSITDSLAHARSLYPGKRNSLDALCERYEISNAHRQLHGALLDSRLLAEVGLAMTRGQESLAIEEAPVVGHAVDSHRQRHYDLPSIVLSVQEHEAHEAYLDALDEASGGKALWRSLVHSPT